MRARRRRKKQVIPSLLGFIDHTSVSVLSVRGRGAKDERNWWEAIGSKWADTTPAHMSGWSCFAEPKDVECFMKIYNGPLLTSNCLDTNRSIEFVVNATMIAPILVVGCFGNCTKVYNPNSYTFLLLRRKQKIRRGLWSCQLFDLWSIPVVVLGFIYLSFFIGFQPIGDGLLEWKKESYAVQCWCCKTSAEQNRWRRREGREMKKEEEEEERGKKRMGMGGSPWCWNQPAQWRWPFPAWRCGAGCSAPHSRSPSVRPVGLVTLLRQHPVSSGCSSVSSLFARHYSSSATVSPYDSVPTCSLLLACEILLSRQ